ncbi:MAG: ABC transporter substrate-binding protein [Actinomycetota bacterium]
MKIAFLQDGSIDSPNVHELPAFLGMKLALGQAIDAGELPVLPELVGFDMAGDPEASATMVAEVIADPAYVAAVAGPYWRDVGGVIDRLAAAGIPTLSLSALAASPTPGWFPLVAGLRRQATALAGYVRGVRGGEGVCLAGDGSPFSRSLTDMLEIGFRGMVADTVVLDPARDAVAQASAAIDSAGCSTVAWTGYGTGAAELRNALTLRGRADVRMVGADAMKDDVYLELAGGTADGTVVACPCVDVSATTDAASQRFVHDFQAEFAIPPGVFAAEGWDAGGLLLRAFTAGAATSSSVRGALGAAPSFAGLAATYDLRSGTPSPQARVRLYRAEGGRWVPLGTPGTPSPSVRTTGVLAVGSCRVGAPYAYRDGRGRLTGFDVEFARAIARRLGLALSWTRTSCAAGTAPVDRGRVDVLLTARARLVPGTPASRAFLSTRAALVAPVAGPSGQALIASLGPDDVVGIAAPAPIPRWARRSLGAGGVTLRSFHRTPRRAYALLQRGGMAAVADSEAGAWAAIEHRPLLRVAFTDDTGDDDVMVTGSSTELLAAVDEALMEMLDNGAYALLFGTYFPGATLPDAVGT